ncbi:MAG: RNA polymerase sigma-70 factor [Chitinophaga sp.]|uniref:RNA polymerase sigma factor n=1 Tax=Chitinophaga sp. TaxID=1869181 RepID=UPI001B0F8913|nr:RNA polymerase sigma-70 factor [Chitinophaga sp.]MBO9728614.1 RNA polymerase sigma-70 factor [Chitinophaga sp.]
MNVTGTINEDIYAMRLQQGDEQAFRYVMERYFPVITLFARRFISNHAVAEDVAEETFIKLWHHHKRVTSFQSLKAFLYITAKNACLNELRKEKNQQYRHQVYEANIDRAEDFIANEIIRAEVKAEILRTVNSLPGKMKRVFELGYLEGLPNREIAKALQISVNTVKGQKARALELVKEKLQGRDILPLALLLLAAMHKD